MARDMWIDRLYDLAFKACKIEEKNYRLEYISFKVCHPVTYQSVNRKKV